MPIYILQYPYENSSISYGIINGIFDYNIEHKCSTKEGSSGSPILSLDSLKVIGIHKGSNENSFEINYGTLLREPILEFNGKKAIDNIIRNEINLALKINKQNINLDIYILNVPYSNGETYITQNNRNYKMYYNKRDCELKDLNKEDIQMFINGELSEFDNHKLFNEKAEVEISELDKCKKFEKEGNYHIKLKFKKLLTSCKYMLRNCFKNNRYRFIFF